MMLGRWGAIMEVWRKTRLAFVRMKISQLKMKRWLTKPYQVILQGGLGESFNVNVFEAGKQ